MKKPFTNIYELFPSKKYKMTKACILCYLQLIV